MSVMECLCDCYNSKVGYICYSCLEELKNLQKTKPDMNENDIISFMETSNIYAYKIRPMIDLDEYFGND